ncbi:PRC and DUF2382 domain-containing protein [Rhodococcus aerolatus]
MTVKDLPPVGQLTNATVHGSDGEKLGKVADIYLDEQTDKPEWAAVKTGMFGGHVALVPLAEASHDGDTLTVPYTKDQIKNAPHQDPAQELSPAQEAELFTHYGIAYGGETVTAQPEKTNQAEAGQHEQGQSGNRADHSGEQGVVGHDTSGPTTDEAMTRSEEQLRVGTRTEEVGRARLRKHVVTEEQTRTVPVSHEEVSVTREPITEANRPAATDGPAISEEEHEVVLHAEKPVVEKETVPVERIKLDTETVTDEQTVTGEVRKEQVEVTDPSTTDAKRK